MPIFKRHYTVEEANALLPRLRRWFEELRELDDRMMQSRETNQPLLDNRLYDVGGRSLSEHLSIWFQWRSVVERILRQGIQIKDLQRGLLDFPHLLEDTGEEVFLCWEVTEPEVEHWHRLDAGYAGRYPIRRPQRQDKT